MTAADTRPEPQRSGVSGKTIAILATDGVEESELAEPRKALDAAGATTVLVSPKSGEIQAVRHHEQGATFTVDRTLADAHASEFSALVLPGGVANPDALRTDQQAVQFVREFMVSDKPVAAICHGPWLLVEADVVRGRTVTSWPSLRTDIENAGGDWVDRPVVVDERLVTSRKPDDLPQFNEAMIRVFANAADQGKVDMYSEQSFPASDAPPGPISL